MGSVPGFYLPYRGKQTSAFGGVDPELISSLSEMALVFVTVNMLQFGECFAPFPKRKLGKVTTGRKETMNVGQKISIT